MEKIILDVKTDKEFSLANGIKPILKFKDAWTYNKSVCEGVTFRNFYRLNFARTTFKNCTFENCENIYSRNCKMENCTFINTPNVGGPNSTYAECIFKDIAAEFAMLGIEGTGKVEGCTFENITIGDFLSYVVIYHSEQENEFNKVKNCKFINCKTESFDGQLCCCSTFEGMLDSTTHVDIMDYDTCEIVIR